MATSEVTLVVEGTAEEVEARVIANARAAFGQVHQARVNAAPLDVARLREPKPVEDTPERADPRARDGRQARRG